MKQSILVLGANGFIGRKLVAALARADWATPILGTRNPSNHEGGKLERRTVEATSRDSVSAALQGVTAVVNCVAGDARTIVSGAEALFAAAAATSTVRVVHLSTMSVYGSATGRIDETASLRPDLGPYSEAKVAAERVAARYAHAVILRPGCVFGPDSDQWSVRIARLLLSRRLGDLGAAGDGCCNLVHVDDVVLAIIRALQRPATDGVVFNLSTQEPPTWNKFLVQFAIALHAVPVRRISGRRLRIEAKLLAPPLKIAEIAARAAKIDLRHLSPPIPPSLLRLMRQDIRLDTGRAETQLGLQWKPLDVALATTAQWFLESERRR